MRICAGCGNGWSSSEKCLNCDSWNINMGKDYPEKCPECGGNARWTTENCAKFKVIISGKVHRFCVLGFLCHNCKRTSFGRIHRMDVKCRNCGFELSSATHPRVGSCHKKFSNPLDYQFDR